MVARYSTVESRSFFTNLGCGACQLAISLKPACQDKKKKNFIYRGCISQLPVEEAHGEGPEEVYGRGEEGDGGKAGHAEEEAGGPQGADGTGTGGGHGVVVLQLE